MNQVTQKDQSNTQKQITPPSLQEIRKKISNLSDSKLLSSTHNVARQERYLLAILIEHLSEIERRKLYSDLQYHSLYEYCVKELKLSEDQAYRRVTAMRLAQKDEVVRKKIEKGELSMSNLNLLHGLFREVNLKQDEKQEAIELASNSSKNECKRRLDEFKKKHGIVPKPKRPVMRPDTENTIRFNVSLQRETFLKIRRLQGHYAHQRLELPDVIDRMADALLEKNEISNNTNRLNNQKSPKNSPSISHTNPNSTSRYINPELKKQIRARAQNRCEKCGSTYALEFDHIKPIALGGPTNYENLRLLCRNCNQRQGIKTFGMTKMNRN